MEAVSFEFSSLGFSLEQDLQGSQTHAKLKSPVENVSHLPNTPFKTNQEINYGSSENNEGEKKVVKSGGVLQMCLKLVVFSFSLKSKYFSEHVYSGLTKSACSSTKKSFKNIYDHAKSESQKRCPHNIEIQQGFNRKKHFTLSVS